jgi:hypothetical protein
MPPRILPYDNQSSTDTVNLVKSDRRTGAPYTSNWGISFAPDDGQVLRILP